ncbi:hypothetical protein QFZ87_003649 [Bacillus sp. SLBN-46]|nr:hypothetical protein [Bacillus sp. SLBN-46]
MKFLYFFIFSYTHCFDFSGIKDTSLVLINQLYLFNPD